MKLSDCHNFYDFRKLAKKKLPSPIFHYIDGAADDEITYRRNTSAFNDVDLVPNVLRGVENVDLSTTIFGKKLDLPFYCKFRRSGKTCSVISLSIASYYCVNG